MEKCLAAFKQYYVEVLKQQYADFNGRARRRDYWMFVLFNVIFAVIASILDGVIGITLIGAIYSLAILVPSIAFGVRRLHDIGKSGWWYLIVFIPLVGAIWLIVLFCTDSQAGENEWGANPKEIKE